MKSPNDIKDEELEAAAEEFIAGKQFRNSNAKEVFKAGARWSEERAKVLVDALEAECPCINNFPDGKCHCGIRDVLAHWRG